MLRKTVTSYSIYSTESMAKTLVSSPLLLTDATSFCLKIN